MAGYAVTSLNPWLRLLARPPAGARYVFTLTGTARAANNAAVPGATVYLHDWPSMTPVGMTTISDVAGNFQFNPPTNGTYKCTFHLAGAPNYFGITDVLVPS